jgi:hypothetical protein
VTKAHRLVWVSMQFDAERYDAQADQTSALAAKVNAAWIRPLNNAVRLQIGQVGLFGAKAGTALLKGNDWFPIGEVQLTFADGETVTLAFDQAQMTQAAEKKRSDDLLTAIRNAIGC